MWGPEHGILYTQDFQLGLPLTLFQICVWMAHMWGSLNNVRWARWNYDRKNLIECHNPCSKPTPPIYLAFLPSLFFCLAVCLSDCISILSFPLLICFTHPSLCYSVPLDLLCICFILNLVTKWKAKSKDFSIHHRRFLVFSPFIDLFASNCNSLKMDDCCKGQGQDVKVSGSIAAIDLS